MSKSGAETFANGLKTVGTTSVYPGVFHLHTSVVMKKAFFDKLIPCCLFCSANEPNPRGIFFTITEDQH